MTKFLILGILLPFLFSSSSVLAEPARRSLELELEEIPGITGYEVRVSKIVSGKKKKPAIFKLKKNIWAANLVPGKYEMSVRSVDARGVPGEWGPPQEFLVKTPAPVLQNPKAGFVVKSEDNSREKIKFEWSKIEGVEKYKIKIFDRAKNIVEEKVLSENEVEFKLTAAQSYEWSVTSIFEDDMEGESTALQKIDVLGAPLEAPESKELEEFNTQIVHWSKVDLAEGYDFVLEKKSEEGSWKVVDQKIVPQRGRKYTQALPTGEYRFKVKAVAHMRQDSEILVKEFKTRRYDGRTPAAIEQIKAESSFDTKSNLFALASYYITIVSYTSRSTDYNSLTRYAPIGGTGRLGLGSWFKEDGAFGFLSVADLSGYIIQGTAYTYTSLDLLGVYRNRLGSVGQLRVHLGGRYRELPLTVGDPNNVSRYAQSKISNIGPVLNLNLAHGFSRKYGLQVHGSIYSSLIGMAIPNGKSNESRVSFQAGLLGSMRLADGLVGFAGYSYRSELAGFAMDPVTAASNSSQGSDPNTVEINGHYLNLMLEYGF